MRGRPWVPVLVIAAIVVALMGCSGPSASAPTSVASKPVAPGAGGSIADQVYRAAGLKMGEALVTMQLEGPSASADTRVRRAIESSAAWTLASPERITKPSDRQRVFTYSFRDGSSLILAGPGVLESVEVTRSQGD
jgi:hypothetical protein